LQDSQLIVEYLAFLKARNSQSHIYTKTFVAIRRALEFIKVHSQDDQQKLKLARMDEYLEKVGMELCKLKTQPPL
jgi:hypothetical protein